MKHRFKILLMLVIPAVFSLGAAAQSAPANHDGESHRGPPGGFTPPGHDARERRGPPGEDFIPPGQDPDFVPPGRNPDFIPPGQDPDFVPPGRVVAARMRGDDQPRFRGGPSGRRGMSSIARLTFTPRDPETGEPVEDREEGSWGLLIYRWIAPEFDFVFSGKELEPDSDWTLTYQPQDEGAEEGEFVVRGADGIICLGGGIVNEDGDLNFQDSVDIETDLPADGDANEDEAVLALVDSDDVDCESGEMLAWNPDAYLFGTQGMFYVRADEIPDDGEEQEEDD